MAIKSQFPALKPTADFNFAATKTLDPRITFSRASPATYYDGKTLAKAEENLLTYSADLLNAIWSASGVTKAASSTAAPDGSITAFSITELATSTAKLISQGFYAYAGKPYTESIYVRKGSLASARPYFQLAFSTTPFGGSSYANFNIQTGVVETPGVGLTSASITDAGSGWWRLAITGTPSSTGTAYAYFCAVPSATSLGAEVYAGDIAADVLLWHPQVEQRDFVGPDLVTTGAAITNWQPVLLTAPAGMPRFQHDPVTGMSLGFLSERQITNSILWSEFGGSTITTGANRFAGSISEARMFGPDGGLVKAVRFARNASVATQIVKGSAPATAVCVFSAYVKMDDGGAPIVGGFSSSTNDFSVVIANIVVPAANITIEHVGNSIYRVSGYVTTGTTVLTSNGIFKYPTQSDRSFRTTGWQLEQHSKATSYIKTEGSQVTRLADTAIIDGANLDSFYSQRGGTFLIDAMLSSAATAAVLNLSYGTANSDRLNIYVTQGSSTLSTDNLVNSTASGSVSATGAVLVQPGRRVIVRRAADYNHAVCVNGGAVTASTSGRLGLRNRLEIGATAGGALQLDSPIARLAYYDELLTDAQMQALTKV